MKRYNNLAKPLLSIFMMCTMYINPFVSVIVASFLSIFSARHNAFLGKIILTNFIVFSVLLQSTRTWNNRANITDWEIGYSSLYNSLTTISFSHLINYKEPVWLIINFISKSFIGLSDYQFLSSVAFTTIIIFSFSIFKFWRHIRATPLQLAISLALLLFSLDFIGMLNNILRIYFALSIVVFASVQYVEKDKKPIFWFIIATLVHNSMIFFLILFSVNVISKELKPINITRVLLFLLLLYHIFPLLKYIISYLGQNFVGSIVLTFLGALNPNDIYAFSSLIIFINLLFFVPISIYVSVYHEDQCGHKFFTNIIICILFFSFIFSFFMHEIAGRLIILKFGILPFIIPYVEFKSKIITVCLQTSFLCWILLVYFYNFNKDIGDKLYLSLNEILGESLFGFF
jgi:hypothetical protein